MNHLHKSLGLGIGAFLLVVPFTLFAQDTSAAAAPHMEGRKPQINPTAIRHTGGTSTDEGMRGGRIMASDTRPLPKVIQKNIDLREGTSGRIFASSTKTGGLPHEKIMGSSTRGERSAAREQTGEHRAEIFKHTGAMMLKRMHAAIDRFAKLADRIDSRIKKMKAGGTDTSLAEAALLGARTNITVALKAVTEAESAINTVADNMNQGSSTPLSSDEKKPAKDALEKARKAILAAQQSLNDLIPLLTGKQNHTREEATASGTPAVPKMMRTKDSSMPTTTTNHPDGTL